MKRTTDFLLALLASVLLALPLLLIALWVKATSPGPVLYWSDRVGRNNVLFRMPKFRSMRIDTPELATHLLDNPQQWLTPIGSFLRRSSLDELPQLWSILVGDMSFVGPRPALFNQHDLIELRNLLQTADLIVRSALKRRESRGLHFSRDWPEMAAPAVPTILVPTTPR